MNLVNGTVGHTMQMPISWIRLILFRPWRQRRVEFACQIMERESADPWQIARRQSLGKLVHSERILLSQRCVLISEGKGCLIRSWFENIGGDYAIKYIALSIDST